MWYLEGESPGSQWLSPDGLVILYVAARSYMYVTARVNEIKKKLMIYLHIVSPSVDSYR